MTKPQFNKPVRKAKTDWFVVTAWGSVLLVAIAMWTLVLWALYGGEFL